MRFGKPEKQGNHRWVYKHPSWEAIRRAVLARDGHKCSYCGVPLAKGRKGTHAAVVDHTAPVSLAPNLAFDLNNLKSVCKPCHDGPVKSAEMRGGDNLDDVLARKEEIIGSYMWVPVSGWDE